MSSGLQAGTVFADRYKILRRIASGGMGAVYEVMHLETERRRALKVMHPHILQSAEMHERFKREAKVAANIESDFIVDVFDAGVDEATQMPFLVMELLRGEELGQRLKRLGRFPPGEVVLYLHQTALALDKTHKASIVHRDLKPENLFLSAREDSPPRIKVLDFGIAKIVAEGAATGSTTQSIGTPLYMSPEQYNPSAKLSGASDIYALGMIAYTLLVGVTYWSKESRDGNIFAMAAAAIHGPPEPASVRAAAKGVRLPPAFDAWFARATAAHPASRFPTATAAVRALAEVFGLPLSLSDPSLSQTERAPYRSGTWENPPPRPALAGAYQMPGPGAPAAVTEAALSAPSPGMTAIGASMTKPVRKEKGKRGLVAIGLALGALGIGGVIYALRPQSAASPASAGDPAEVAPKTAPAEEKASPTTEPARASDMPQSVTSAASAPPEPDPSSVPDSSKPPPQKRGDKPAPSSTAKAPLTPSAPRTIPIRKKYTQE
jgi:eukaryotic-like serine/threonine-protein kinase